MNEHDPSKDSFLRSLFLDNPKLTNGNNSSYRIRVLVIRLELARCATVRFSTPRVGNRSDFNFTLRTVGVQSGQ